MPFNGNTGHTDGILVVIRELLDKIYTELVASTPGALATEATLVQVRDAVQNIDLDADTLIALQTAISGYVDGLEALATSANALLTTLSTLDYATETTLVTVGITAGNIYNNVASKMNRISGAANYNRTITYVNAPGGDFRVATIVHTGTTALGVETITETFTYYLTTDNVTNIAYS